MSAVGPLGKDAGGAIDGKADLLGNVRKLEGLVGTRGSRATARQVLSVALMAAPCSLMLAARCAVLEGC
jgi:hypothetical protein